MHLLSLIKKEFLLEFRGKEIALVLLSLILMLSSICAAGASSAFIEPRYVKRLLPVWIWIVVTCAGVLASMRTHEGDLERKAIDSLLLLKVNPALIFISKVLCLWVVLSLGFFLASILLAGLLGVDISKDFLEMLCIGVTISFGLASLFVLLGAISTTSKLRGVLLPILAFPLLFPFFFAGVELLELVLTNPGATFGEPWFFVALMANLIYFLAGITLYSSVIRE